MNTFYKLKSRTTWNRHMHSTWIILTENVCLVLCRCGEGNGIWYFLKASHWKRRQHDKVNINKICFFSLFFFSRFSLFFFFGEPGYVRIYYWMRVSGERKEAAGGWSMKVETIFFSNFCSFFVRLVFSKNSICFFGHAQPFRAQQAISFLYFLP